MQIPKALRTAVFWTMLVSPAAAATLTANFDSFPEGFSGTTITDGGITFGDLDVRLPPAQPGSFSIEATTSPLFSPFLSPSNYLTTFGVARGPAFSFGRFGAASMTFGPEFGDSARMDIFSLFAPSEGSQNSLTLQALLDGQIVSSASIDFAAQGSGILHQVLFVSGAPFDQLALMASGSQDDASVFAGIDNVTIDPVPEPGTLLFFGAGLMVLAGSGCRARAGR